MIGFGSDNNIDLWVQVVGDSELTVSITQNFARSYWRVICRRRISRIQAGVINPRAGAIVRSHNPL